MGDALDYFLHPSADVAPDARIGKGTRIWHNAQIRSGAHIGSECIIGKNVYIDFAVVIGNRVKIQNNVSIYHGVTIEDGVFIGPHVCFSNDVFPRAITPEGLLKSQDDWVVGTITVCYGASLGAGAIIVPNVTIGSFALVGAGAVVTHSVPDHALVYGNPARLCGYVCRCGHKLVNIAHHETTTSGNCPVCQSDYTLTMGSVLS